MKEEGIREGGGGGRDKEAKGKEEERKEEGRRWKGMEGQIVKDSINQGSRCS